MIFFPTTISVRSPTYIQMGFNADVGEVTIDNFLITADRNPDDILTVYSVEVRGKVVDIVCSPAFPLASYTISLRDGASAFASLTGELLSEDAAASKVQFVGPEEANPIRDRMGQNLTSIYDASENNALHAYVSSISKEVLSAVTAVKQTSNASYIEEIATDIVMIRSVDAADRLPEESAYQVDRVARAPTGTTASRGNFDFETADRTNPLWDSFPSAPYLLRQVMVTEVVSNIETVQNSFTGLTVTVEQPYVIAVLNLSLNQMGVDYVYDITEYPVMLLSNRYDPDFAVVNTRLESNQIQIPQLAIDELHIPYPTSSDVWTITYSYDDRGTRALQDPRIYSIESAVREIAPAATNVFSLAHPLIVDATGATPSSDGVVFAYPAATATSIAYAGTHPAFRFEIEFDRLSPPSKPGEYAVDYSTGQVLVFGEDITGTGTGTIPPAATYLYSFERVPGVDFVLDTETDEIVATVDRNLAGENVFLEYRYEQVFRPDTDYIAEVHNEVIEEFVENRFVGLDRIRTEHFPITDVFTITNETTGEQYRAAAFSHNEITISGDELPRRAIITGEPALFSSTVDETLLVGDTVSSGVQPVVRVILKNNQVLAATGGFIGSALDSSLMLDGTYFVSEWFFDKLDTLANNILNLGTVGDYCVDYHAGYLYVKVSANIGPGIGTASYRYATIEVGNPYVTSVDSVRYATNGGQSTILELPSTFSSTEILPLDLPASTEQFVADTDLPLILGSVASGKLGYWRMGEDIFRASDSLFDSSVVDGYHYLRLEGDSDKLIIELIDSVSVRVDIAFSDDAQEAGWQLYQINQASEFTVATTYPAQFVKGVYFTSEVQTLPVSQAANLWQSETDSFSDYIITSANPLLDGYPAGTSLTVVYDFGTMFLDYERLVDSLRVSYEWGDNSIRWINSPTVDSTYFVTYRYGALRRELKENFASMLGLQDLIDADMEFPRESVRDLTKAAYQIFSGGPTYRSLLTLGETPTLIKPDVQELSFDEWTLGRDHLYDAAPAIVGDPAWGLGRWGSGLDTSATYLSAIGDNVVAYRSGAFSTRVQNQWFGINNNADVTFDFDVSAEDIYIGTSGWHPDTVPFTISSTDAFPFESIGRPSQFWSKPGLHVWFDAEDLQFKCAYVGVAGETATGTISTDGEFAYRQDGYVDGYGVEQTDVVRTGPSLIECQFSIDGYDSSSIADGYLDALGAEVIWPIYSDIVGFVASHPNYFFDTGTVDGGRMSLFKDTAGYLVFSVIDESNHRWSISTNISDWLPGEDHTVGASWKLNSSTSSDEMHLFVDGRETSNIIRWGGIDPGTVPFRSVAIEVVEPSLVRPIVYEVNGVSTAASSSFVAQDTDFVALGILPGDTLTILENTNDGLGSPYTITAVGDGYLDLSSPLTLSLDTISYVVNQGVYALDTNLDAKFVVYVNGIEIAGPDATIPMYSVERVSGMNYLTVWADALIGATITAETRGLTLSRAKFMVARY